FLFGVIPVAVSNLNHGDHGRCHHGLAAAGLPLGNQSPVLGLASFAGVGTEEIGAAVKSDDSLAGASVSATFGRGGSEVRHGAVLQVRAANWSSTSLAPRKTPHCRTPDR